MSLPQKIQTALLDPCHSPAGRGQKVAEWLDYLEKNAGWLLGSTNFSKLRAEASQGLTPQEAVDFSAKIGPASNFGFLPATLSKLERKELYKLDRRRRNEWWTLSGTFSQGNQQQRGALTLLIWRHTARPPGLWSDQSGQNESSLWIKHTLTIGEAEPVTGTTPVLPESTFLATLDVAPFAVVWGSQFFRALQQDTLFPLATHFTAANGTQITLDLDNEKPMFMPAGNGCVQCRDGMGLKTYFFPKVTGQGTLDDELITFEGSLEHSWESGMLPLGAASSTMVQSFDTIGQVLLPDDSTLNRAGRWLHLTLALANNYQLSTYLLPFHVVPFEWLPMTSTVMSCPDGTVVAYGTNEAAFRIEHWGDDDRIVASFRLLPRSATKPHLFALITGAVMNIQVSCTWKCDELETMVVATGFLNLAANGHQATSAQMTSHTEVALSFLLWLIPLIVVVLLVCLVIYLIAIRKPRYRWLQPTVRHRLG